MISDISNDTEDVEVSYMLMSIPLLYIDVFLHLISWGVFFFGQSFYCTRFNCILLIVFEGIGAGTRGWGGYSNE